MNAEAGPCVEVEAVRSQTSEVSGSRRAVPQTSAYEAVERALGPQHEPIAVTSPLSGSVVAILFP